MSKFSFSTVAALAALGMGLAGATARAQTWTQTLNLHAGWNSIHIEVEPTNNSIGAVFTNLPVESIWTFSQKNSPAEFIKNQNELPWENPGWRRFLPPSSPKSFLTTLYTVNANRAYLVRLTNAATLTLTGRPSVQSIRWTPNAYNLRGFPVDPNGLPTFARFFAPSPAHAGQPAYRLNASGLWEQVASTETMQSGEAYWVYTDGGSDFTAPLSLSVDGGDGLDYAKSLNERVLTLKNLSQDRSMPVEVSSGTDSSPLSYWGTDVNGALLWTDLPTRQTRFLEPGQSEERRLAIQRRKMTAESYATVLEVRDNQGTRFLVPLIAGKVMPAGAAARPAGFAPAGVPAADSPANHVGLWVGNATLNAVNEPQGINPTNRANPTATSLNGRNAANQLNLRLIVHVATDGTAQLLKEVVQLWKDGNYLTNAFPNPENTNQLVSLRVVDTNHPGRFVLLTDENRFAEFKGAALRDGQPVGRRISSVGMDFPGQSLPMTGAFALENNLAATIHLDSAFSTNPFRHQYHPDHTNGFDITRQITLRFSTNLSSGTVVADLGYNVIGGTYSEIIGGLHKTNLVVSGSFRLDRVAVTGELNPQTN